MLQSIWIPRWLYRWLPWASVVVGCGGLWFGGFGFVMMLVCLNVAGYGAVILTERSMYAWEEHCG